METEQAKIHQKLLDALQQSLLKKREAEVRLQEIERMNGILRARIAELGGDVGRSGTTAEEVKFGEEVEDGFDVSVDLGADSFEASEGEVDPDVSADLSLEDSFDASEDGVGSEEEEDEDEEDAEGSDVDA